MKVANSYASLLKGVSQQTPQDRAEGQHGEQVNMLSDPVVGLTRRFGSVRLGEKHLTGLSTADFAVFSADTARWKSYDYDFAGKEYTVLYRAGPRPLASGDSLPGLLVYNKTDNVWLTTTRNLVDSQLDAIESGGVAAITSVGKYVFIAGNTVGVTAGTVQLWGTSDNFDRVVVWVRGGAFSRVFKVTVTSQTGVSTTVSHTTPSASYQGTLTTADILTGDPDYVKKVNDRVNAYNGAVTAWIGTSTAAIQPGAIAAQIAALFNAASIPCTAIGSHVCFDTSANLRTVSTDDGGDNSLLRGVGDEIASADRTSVVHAVGKVVMVRSGSNEAYYLKAVPKNPAVVSGYTEVTWVEGAAIEHTINVGLTYLTVVGNNAYVAASATLLTALTPGPHPAFVKSTVGDADSQPLPYFCNRFITYLGTFQNRLLVGSGGVLFASRTEDYLNFFRSTTLTLPASDPLEMLPQGSEDDRLRSSTMYDQDLVVFGDKRQYLISGSQALTPTSANMAVMSSYENATDAAPVSAGGYVFYVKGGTGFASVQQIQPGQNVKSPESFPASSQIARYLQGTATELVSYTGDPTNHLFLRTQGSRNGMFVFSYLDKQDGRKLDSWSRWEFNSVLGATMGMSLAPDGLTIFFVRVDGSKVFVVADRVSLLTGLSDQAYLDSSRNYSDVATGTNSVTLASGAQWAAAFATNSQRRFTGALLPDVAELLTSYPTEPLPRVGALYEAYVTLTNPYMRDGNNKAIQSGRLTITKLNLSYESSIGFKWAIDYRGSVTSYVFNGRVLGNGNNLIGIEPISTGQKSIPIGKETREYSLTIAARPWYPLTITAIEWSGQFFNRVQRF